MTSEEARDLATSLLAEPYVHVQLVQAGTDLARALLASLEREESLRDALGKAIDSLEAYHGDPVKQLSENGCAVCIAIDEGLAALAAQEQA